MINNKVASTQIGKVAEDVASTYLINQGLTFVTKNFHSRQGEIDLIMRDQSTLVFIEVKYRKNSNFGGAIAAIPYSKQQKIHKCASFYLHSAGLNEYNTPCRFDVMTLQGDLTAQLAITWLKNAF